MSECGLLRKLVSEWGLLRRSVRGLSLKRFVSEWGNTRVEVTVGVRYMFEQRLRCTKCVLGEAPGEETMEEQGGRAGGYHCCSTPDTYK